MTIAPRPGYTKDGKDTGHVNPETIVAYVTGYWLAHGFGPCVREVQRSLDISSTSVVNHHLTRLVKQGHLSRVDGWDRTLRPANWREYLKGGECK